MAVVFNRRIEIGFWLELAAVSLASFNSMSLVLLPRLSLSLSVCLSVSFSLYLLLCLLLCVFVSITVSVQRLCPCVGLSVSVGLSGLIQS